MYTVRSLDVNYAAAGVPEPEKAAELKVFALPFTEDISMRADRPLVLIVPGGGYEYCSNREAEPIAMKFLARGIHAAVLRYSCSPACFPTAALELARSIQICRENAAAWHVMPTGIAVCGFSAGGHLAGTLGTLWDHPCFGGVLNPAVSWKPDLQLLCYAVLTMGEYTHIGSRDHLLGFPEEAGNQRNRIGELSLETRVRPETPPTFLWHTAEDGSVPVENSLMYAMACRKHGVPFELHVFERGAHGLATCEDLTARDPGQIVPDDAAWMDMAVRFVLRHTAG